MKIEIPKSLMQALQKKNPCDLYEDLIRESWNERPIVFQIKDLRPGELETLMDLATPGMEKGIKEHRNLWNKLRTYQNVTGAKKGKPVGTLEALCTALIDYVKNECQKQWLFRQDGENFLPYYVRNIQYHPYKDECPAQVTVTMVAMERGNNERQTLTFYKEDLNQTVVKCLADCLCYAPTKELMEAYEKASEKLGAISGLTGDQFSATGKGHPINGGYSYGVTELVKDGVPAKVVMDDEHADTDEEGREIGARGDCNGYESNSFWMSQHDKENADNAALPVHPYVKVFHLEEHRFYKVHVNDLEPYKFNPAVADKLVLPVDVKELIEILIESAAEQLEDIIAGKTGGTIILATGHPGIGKTLTAEVFSEYIERPLYSVQCSQLGTDEETIEKQLKAVLGRANRWKAILLIDEADVYVRTRGEDIQQNAIVGVFLRVLEYYRGILFMTSNRATAIDDAILSRATAHIRYSMPTEEERLKLWKILARQFDIELSDFDLTKAAHNFQEASGRNIKNLLKLGKRYASGKKRKLTLPDLHKVAKFIDMPRKGEEGTK